MANLKQCAKCRKAFPYTEQFVQLANKKEVCSSCWKEIQEQEKKHPRPFNQPLFR